MDNLYHIGDPVMYKDKDWVINSVQTYEQKNNDDKSMPDPNEEPTIRVEYHLISNRVAIYSMGKLDETWDVEEDDLEPIEE